MWINFNLSCRKQVEFIKFILKQSTNAAPKAGIRAQREVGFAVAKLFAPGNAAAFQANRMEAINALMVYTEMSAADATTTRNFRSGSSTAARTASNMVPGARCRRTVIFPASFSGRALIISAKRTPGPIARMARDCSTSAVSRSPSAGFGKASGATSRWCIFARRTAVADGAVSRASKSGTGLQTRP